MQTKGKAAIDVICNPLGKSGGAFIQQIMIIGFGSLAASTPYLGAILFFIVGTWILAANDLSKLFKQAQVGGTWAGGWGSCVRACGWLMRGEGWMAALPVPHHAALGMEQT